MTEKTVTLIIYNKANITCNQVIQDKKSIFRYKILLTTCHTLRFFSITMLPMHGTKRYIDGSRTQHFL